MDDTQNATQPSVNQSQPAVGSQPSDINMPSMSDVAGMTPPPAPVMPTDMSTGMTPPPAMPEPSLSASPAVQPMDTTLPISPMPEPLVTPAAVPAVSPLDAMNPTSTVNTVPSMPEPSAPAVGEPMHHLGASDENYSYAEDILNEILDSLDRIEAKLEAIEKKQG